MQKSFRFMVLEMSNWTFFESLVVESHVRFGAWKVLVRVFM